MDKYIGTRPKNDICISKLFTVHYFEYSSNFAFCGEKHDFWEFVYVDKGAITAASNDRSVPLSQGKVIFHKPNEWHNIHTDQTANVAIVSFACDSPAMEFFENKVLTVGQMQKNLISKLYLSIPEHFPLH